MNLKRKALKPSYGQTLRPNFSIEQNGKKARAGNGFYKGVEIPLSAKIFTIKSGQECYLSGITNDNGIWKASVFVIDNLKFVERTYSEIEKYL